MCLLFELGKPLDGGAVGEVIESRAKEFKPGDAVTSNFGWREYFVASSKELHPVSREIQPLSVYLGALGMTGMTAWTGLNLVEVKAGDVIFISGAAGAVGSVAGQLAKLRGCRVIGSAGSAEKVKFLREDCGFDIAFNYGSPREFVKHPKSIDVWHLGISPAMIARWRRGRMPFRESPDSQYCDSRGEPARDALFSESP